MMKRSFKVDHSVKGDHELTHLINMNRVNSSSVRFLSFDKLKALVNVLKFDQFDIKSQKGLWFHFRNGVNCFKKRLSDFSARIYLSFT